MTSSLMDSLRLAVVAMGVVFVALYGLSLVMEGFPKILGPQKTDKPKQQATAAPVVEPASAVADNANPIPAQTIAVIASAIAAYLGRAPEDLNVIAIRRTGANLSPWALHARRDSVQN